MQKQTTKSLKRFALLALLIAWLCVPITKVQADSPASDRKAYIQSLAESGNAQAQYGMGYAHLNGMWGFAKSSPKAFEWFTKAAAQNHAAAQSAIAYLYAKGDPKDFPRNDEKAAEWFTKAAENGEPTAMRNIGRMHERGQGVPQNYELAMQWYRKAAKLNQPSAKYDIGVLYEKGRGVPQNWEKAIHWYHAAGKDGVAGANAVLGWIYANGKGAPKDESKAYIHYSLAAASGHKSSQLRKEIAAEKLGGGAIYQEAHAAFQKQLIAMQKRQRQLRSRVEGDPIPAR